MVFRLKIRANSYNSVHAAYDFYLVQCPICGQWVVSDKINAHIDADCLEPTAPDTSSPLQQVDVQANNSMLDKDTPRPSSSVPTRIAPLFAPKPATQPKSQQFPDRKNVHYNHNAVQKRGTDAPSETPAKRKKTDAALESMPLAARGKQTHIH